MSISSKPLPTAGSAISARIATWPSTWKAASIV